MQPPLSAGVSLRPVQNSDLSIFYSQQLDPQANYMAAFTVKDPSDRQAFRMRWQRILADKTVTVRTIVWQDEVAGHIARFVRSGNVELTYWLGREFWGQGIATAALRIFLLEFPIRPLYARVATDNVPSRRVLEKCGFNIIDQESGYANARNCEVDEYVLKLDAENADQNN